MQQQWRSHAIPSYSTATLKTIDIKRNFKRTQKWYVHDSSALENLENQMSFFTDMSNYAERLRYINVPDANWL